MTQEQGTLVELFDNAVERFGDSIAFVDRDKTGTSYRELGARASRVTGKLQEMGIQRGDLVALTMQDDGSRWPSTHHGILHAGGVSVLVAPELPNPEIKSRLAFANPKLVLCGREELARIQEQSPQGTRVLSVEEALAYNIPGKTVVVNPGDDAVHIFSSGTTSAKQVRLTHGNVRSNVDATRNIIPLSEYTIYAGGLLDGTHSFAHMISNAGLNLGAQTRYSSLSKFVKGEGRSISPECLLLNPKAAALIKADIEKKFKESEEAKKFARGFAGRALRKFGIVHDLDNLLDEAVEASTNVYKARQEGQRAPVRAAILHHIATRFVYPKIQSGLANKFGDQMRFILGGSAALPSEDYHFFRVVGNPRKTAVPDFRLFQGYGVTETSPVVSFNNPDAMLLDTGDWGVAPSGRVIPGVEVKIADSELIAEKGQVREVQAGKPGTILVYGPNVSPGYYQDAKRTADASVTDDSGRRWYNTRDRGLVRPAEPDKFGRGPYIVVLGRNERLIVFPGGEKLSPETPEAQYASRLTGIADQVLCVGSKVRDRLSLIVLANQGTREEVARGSKSKEQIEQGIKDGLDPDTKKRFGLEIDRVYLDTQTPPTEVTNSLGKLRFNEYLSRMQEKGVLQLVNALDNTTRYL